VSATSAKKKISEGGKGQWETGKRALLSKVILGSHHLPVSGDGGNRRFGE